ncbi:MAG: dephospho-CoA kinase [Firmicutes bacterium]|nr:dephospho-CoA kinase [Bacillota bacterium]
MPIPFLGLTGPTGAGKTTAARILEALGCAVIDCDALAREVVLPGSPVLARLAARFGGDILCKGEILDRALLAERAFASEKARQDLNSITHPAITNLALQRAKALQGKQHVKAIAFDAAALPESELAALCGHILIITAPEDLRLRRILARDGITEAAARRRVEAQRQADYRPPPGVGHTIIDTTEGEAALRHALEKALCALVGGPGDAPGGGAPAAVPPRA